MPETWEYNAIVFSIVKTQNGLMWCWKSGNTHYTLIDALDQFGAEGWELVNIHVDAFELKTRWDNREAMRKVATFKRRTN